MSQNNFDWDGNLNTSISKLSSSLKYLVENYSNIVSNKSQNDQSLVIGINGSYGSGKSTFITNFMQYLTANDSAVKTILYNAWENDYFEDPFLSIVGQIYKAEKNLSNEKKIKFKEAAINFFIRFLLPIASPRVKNAIEVVNDLKQYTQETNEKIFDRYIENYSSMEEEKSNFRNALANLGDSEGTPVLKVIFIDELDRCNPKFAIKVMERVKHFFNAKNTIFVISLDKKQFLSIINKVYGQQLDANNYLLRFFDFWLEMPTSKDFNLKILQNTLDSSEYEYEEAIEIILDFFNMQARETERFARLVKLLEKKIGENKGWKFDVEYYFLIALKIKNSSALKELEHVRLPNVAADVEQSLNDILSLTLTNKKLSQFTNEKKSEQM